MSTRVCGNISILEDSRLENSEMFSVEVNTTDQAVVLNPMMAIVSIADNDSKWITLLAVLHWGLLKLFVSGILFVRTRTTILDVAVGFDQPSYNISEGAGLLNVCAILTGVADREVLVTLTTMEISAEGIATCYF